MFLQCNSIYTNVHLLKILKSTALYCVVFMKFSHHQTHHAVGHTLMNNLAYFPIKRYVVSTVGIVSAS